MTTDNPDSLPPSKKKPSKNNEASGKMGRPRKKGRPTREVLMDRRQKFIREARQLATATGQPIDLSGIPDLPPPLKKKPKKKAKKSPKSPAKSPVNSDVEIPVSPTKRIYTQSLEPKQGKKGKNAFIDPIPPKKIELCGIIWERQDKETIVWYLRFKQYINMPKPNLLLLYRREKTRTLIEEAYLKRNPMELSPPKDISMPEADPDGSIADKVSKIQGLNGTWREAVMTFRWHERLAAYQGHQAMELDELWRGRAEEFRDECWDLYKTSRAKVQAMLAVPLMQQRIETDDQGRNITIIEPARWGFRDTAMLMARVTEMGNSAVGDFSKAIALLLAANFDVRAPGSTESIKGGNDDGFSLEDVETLKGAIDVDHTSDNSTTSRTPPPIDLASILNEGSEDQE